MPQIIVTLLLSTLVYSEQLLGNPCSSLVLLNFELGLSYHLWTAEVLMHRIVPVKDRILSIFQLLLSGHEHLFLQLQVIEVVLTVISRFLIGVTLVLLNLSFNLCHVLLSLLCCFVKLIEVALVCNILTHHLM